jgi:hypothetical protein
LLLVQLAVRLFAVFNALVVSDLQKDRMYDVQTRDVYGLAPGKPLKPRYNED